MAWAALICAVATATLCYPAFSGAFLASPVSDQFIGGYAVRTFGTEILKQTGHFPLWNPYLFGGMPYIGAMNGDIFYPPSLVLRLLLRPDVFVTWAFIVHVFLAGWLTYLFFRKAIGHFVGALIAGVAYMMGGPIASYVSPGHDGKLYVSALLPLALLLLTYGIRDGRRWTWPVLALTVGCATLSPHPQMLQYFLLAGAAWALYLAFGEGRPIALPRRVALRRLGAALGAVGLGLLMGAIQFLPVIEYVASSPRAAGTGGYAFAASFSMPPEELINTYLPQFSGLLGNYWGRTGIHYHSEYLGAVVLMLAGGALIGKPPDQRRQVRFWLGVAFVATLWSLGGYTPFYHLVYVLVPGTKYFRAPAAIFCLTGLAVAMLAGIGAEAALERLVRVRYSIAWMGAATAIIVLAAAGAITKMSIGLAPSWSAARARANEPAVILGAVRCLLLVVVTGGVLAAARAGKLRCRAAGWALILLVVLDLWSVERAYWRFSAPAAVVFAPDSAIAYLEHQPQPARVVTAVLGANVADHDPELTGDALMIHRIEQVHGYHGNELRRYDVLSREGTSASATAPQLWRLLNVRFLLTNVDTVPLSGVQRVVGPVRDAAGTSVYLYRLPGDNPAAWVTPVAVKASDEAALATVTDPRFDPLVAAVFDTAAPVVGQTVAALPKPLGIAVSVTRRAPGHLVYHLEPAAPAGASLVASENYYPGWQATVDGRPGVAARADYTLIGVPLPAGASNVELTFRSSVAGDGEVVTFIAAAAAVLWWLAAALIESRGLPGDAQGVAPGSRARQVSTV